MGWSIGFKLGPLRYNQRVGLPRRRPTRRGGSGGALRAGWKLILGLLLLAFFLCAIVFAPLAGAIAGLFTTPRAPGASALAYTRAVATSFAKLLT